MTNVFVAPKIKVGFQNRSDTFTGQLAYIIYYDEKGKIRKEKSWESWRDKKINPQEFDNSPMAGFTLNKDIKRYSGNWFSSHRTMIRVHDPRGFEFEVTTENLIAILMHTDCLRRGLIGEFVYAWVGPELVLLPTNSEEYQTAVKYTTNLSKRVLMKELVPGISYKTKRDGDAIYIGRLNWHEYNKKYYAPLGFRKEKRVLVFTSNDGAAFFYKDSPSFLSEPNNTTPVSNFAELMDKFNQHSHSKKIICYEFLPTAFNPATEGENYGLRLLRNSYFIDIGNGLFANNYINAYNRYIPSNNGTNGTYKLEGYQFDKYYHYNQAIRGDGEIVESSMTSYNNLKIHDLAYMQAQRFFDLQVTFEDGSKKIIHSISELTSI